MMVRLVLGALKRGKARFACAALGFAAAVGAVVFTTSLAATNSAQAPLLARRAARPWRAWQADIPSPNVQQRPKPRDARAGAADLTLPLISLTVDYRPGGHVLQGPPMRALMTRATDASPFEAVSLAEGRWVSDGGESEVVCVRQAMRRFGAEAPALGSSLVFVGAHGTCKATIVGYLEGDRLPREFPTVFANAAAFEALAAEERGLLSLWREVPRGDCLTPDDERVKGAFQNDEQRRLDYAKPLMLIAAVLTALSLLVNSLLLSVEANRRDLALLRTIGLTRGGVVGFVTIEALLSGLAGWALGVAGGLLGVAAFAHDASSFPAGVAFDWPRVALTLAALPLVLGVAILFALRPALRVRAMTALSAPPRSRRRGMTITFALGFGAFVAVEVWGASLMRAFVPSPEWPDAIVSLLPGGVSSFDIEKLRGIEGVKRISELLPLQVDLPTRPDEPQPAGQQPPRRRAARPNALFLAAEWLPRFRFVEGDWQSAVEGLESGGVVVTEMMSRARHLHVGDELLGLPIVGVVALNWHMVTSRGLVRGLNRMPVMTDGPVFASFDTVEALDRRPAFMVRMTHLWVEYEDGYAEKAGGVFEAGRKVEAEIARRLGYPVQATVRLHARDEIADGTLAHGSAVIGAAARVPYVFLVILSVGFIAMLVAEADARKRELAALRAVGATRAQLAGRLASSALKTALAGIAFGVPPGALAGWLATFKTAAIWPGLPHGFVLPVGLVIEGAFGALLFALAFALPASLAIVARLTRR